MTTKTILRSTWRLARPLLVLLVAWGVAGWLGRGAPRVLLTHVAPWDAGVRQENFGGGLDPVDLAPGLHVALPGLDVVRGIDARGRLTVFGEDLGRAGELVDVHPGLWIRTVEDQKAQVELALAWRVRPGAAHLVVRDALEGQLAARVAKRTAKVLELRLASLTAEQWFDAARRRELVADVEPLLVAELASLHVEATSLHVLGAQFPESYEQKLQEKQVSHQEALLQDALGRVDEARAEVSKLENQALAEEARILAEWDQARGADQAAHALAQAAREAETDAYVKRTKADAEAAYQAALAEGRLAVELAKTVGEELRLAALDGPGGRIHLAAQAAARLRVDEVWLDSRDPDVPSMLDLDELALLLFGGRLEDIPEQLAVAD